mmetsp:Transcript_88464/g.245683  ORF Transcript_88464/g.245683 Transcript_88464/m.245683 type:complete len:211 (+) Transcript_88464:1132-1764(+)
MGGRAAPTCCSRWPRSARRSMPGTSLPCRSTSTQVARRSTTSTGTSTQPSSEPGPTARAPSVSAWVLCAIHWAPAASACWRRWWTRLPASGPAESAARAGGRNAGCTAARPCTSTHRGTRTTCTASLPCPKTPALASPLPSCSGPRGRRCRPRPHPPWGRGAPSTVPRLRPTPGAERTSATSLRVQVVLNLIKASGYRWRCAVALFSGSS